MSGLLPEKLAGKDQEGGVIAASSTVKRVHDCHNRAWRQYKGELRGFLVRRLANAAEADDLLQDVFLKALHQGKDFCSLDNPRAWLFRVARNLLIDRQRLQKDNLPLPEELVQDDRAEFALVDALSQCLPRVLSELSAEDCEALVLCDLQGVAQKDYARRLGLSLAAAKSRVQRARTRLRLRLAEACQVRFDAAGKICCFVPRPALPSPIFPSKPGR